MISSRVSTQIHWTRPSVPSVSTMKNLGSSATCSNTLHAVVHEQEPFALSLRQVRKPSRSAMFPSLRFADTSSPVPLRSATLRFFIFYKLDCIPMVETFFQIVRIGIQNKISTYTWVRETQHVRVM